MNATGAEGGGRAPAAVARREEARRFAEYPLPVGRR